LVFGEVECAFIESALAEISTWRMSRQIIEFLDAI